MIGIGIDIGGTFTKIIAVDKNRKKRAEIKVSTVTDKTPEYFFRQISVSVKRILADLKSKKAFVCVGIAGDVDSKNGVLRFSGNLNRKWKNVPVADLFKKHTKLPCVVDNDANMAAWGAYETKLERKYKHVLAVTLGTGIGGGMILNGDIFRGESGTAGEIGHVTVVKDGNRCNCGNRGCLESYFGANAIVKKVKLQENLHTKMFKNLIEKYGLSAKTVALAAKKGDTMSKNIWKEAGQYLAVALSNFCLVFNPSAIVLTGGLSGAKSLFLPEIKKEFFKNGISTPFKTVRIFVTQTSNLGSLGAALYALNLLTKKGKSGVK
jgi:glucokinase